ncbi:MAG: peroxiredoxin [Cephaloticoccus sp.]|nr:peroxiredoxin [Akkermansiaceae bacterium]MCF7761980.1 peroxiredoxin [Cephaloticoccus sp.]
MKLRAILVLVSFLTMSLFSKAEALKVGDPAPLVTGITETGASLALGDVYARQAYTLVYFYPKADTPGCTAQGCSLRDSYEALLDKGVAVIGVSHDKPDAQKAFKEKYHLPFTLIADTEKSVIEAFGVPTTFGLAKRQAYLIKGGKIVWADYSASTSQQAADVLKVVVGE